MDEVIPNAPAAGGQARAGLSKEESARFFGPPALIRAEDRGQYEALRDRISAAVGPLDFLEEIWVNDVVNRVWEELRLRRILRNVLNGDNEHVLELDFTLRMETAGRIDRMIAGHETRRNVALREIDRHRETLVAGAAASGGQGPGRRIQETAAPFDRRRGGA
jgi:hypothetical protein